MSENERDRTYKVTALDGETTGQSMARASLKPALQSANTRQVFLQQEGASFAEHVEALENQIERTQAGDLSDAKAMLAGQAAALDGVFHCLIQDAYRHIGKRPERAEAMMKAALKAQQQCQATIRTLGELVNPRQIVVAKQANVAQHQQINHGVTQANTRTRAHGEILEGELIRANELLTDERSAQDAATLDRSTKGRAGRKNRALAALGALDRAEDT